MKTHKQSKQKISSQTAQIKKTEQVEYYLEPSIKAQDIADLLKKIHRPLNIDEILKIQKISRRQKKEVLNILSKLISENKVIIYPKHKYALVTTQEKTSRKTYQGTLEVMPNGSGFVDCADKLSFYVAKEYINNAMPKDKVEVQVIKTYKDKTKKPEAKIIKIIEASSLDICVRVYTKAKTKNIYFCEPIEAKYPFEVQVQCDEDLRSYDVILVQLDKKLKNNDWQAKFIKHLGKGDTIQSLELITKATNHISTSYPEAAIKELENLPKDKPKTDLNHLDFVTIDGDDAKDFDDAIYVEKQGANYILYVAIADVSHYVKANSELDIEAYNRGNSFYFPKSVEAMLPFELSNDLCSLKANEKRNTLVAKMTISSSGKTLSSEFMSAQITSKARLTYAQTQDFFDKKVELDKNIGIMLLLAKKLAEILIIKRDTDGGLDFDLPEATPIFDINNKILGFKAYPIYFSNNLIEAFMLAANEAVARYMYAKNIPALYRVHPEPEEEKLEKFYKTISYTSFAKHLDKSADNLKKILKSSAIANNFESKLIHKMALRAMMQAKYSPDNGIHFGLASECYTHFTSPIRRYADLIVHRVLKNNLGLEECKYDYIQLQQIANKCNDQEKISKSTEREMHKRLALSLLQDKVGEKIIGNISGFGAYAIYIELDNYFIDAILRLEDVKGDYYDYDEKKQIVIGKKTKSIFRIGDRIEVVIKDINTDKLEVLCLKLSK